MRVNQARDAARRWVIEEASRILGFCGAYTAGSTNWLSDDAELSTASDLDIMVVLADQNHARRRHKFIYRDAFLEVSYLGNDQLQSPDQVLIVTPREVSASRDITAVVVAAAAVEMWKLWVC